MSIKVLTLGLILAFRGWVVFAAPANDNFLNRSALPSSDMLLNGATLEAGEPMPPFTEALGSVWHTLPAGGTRPYTGITLAVAPEGKVAVVVYSGTNLSSLTQEHVLFDSFYWHDRL